MNDDELKYQTWMLCDMVGRYLCMNEKIKSDDDLYKKARNAHYELWDIYQKIDKDK